jgi:hypothetical protein
MAASVLVAVLLVSGAAVALALLGIDPWITLAGVVIVAVGAALIGAQVAFVGSWLTPRTPPPEAPDEERRRRSRSLARQHLDHGQTLRHPHASVDVGRLSVGERGRASCPAPGALPADNGPYLARATRRAGRWR